MHRSFSVLALALAPWPALAAQSPYQSQIDRWKAEDAQDPPPRGGLVGVGSSSMRFWEQMSRDLGGYDVIQRGFGGSQFSDLNQFVDELVLDYQPAAVVVFEGTNDVAAGKSAQQVFADWRTFVGLVRAGEDPAQPPIEIFYLGITPTPSRWSLWPIASSVNAMIEADAATDPTLHYVDVPTPFLATGTPPAAYLFQPDMLHLTQAGYDLWTSVALPALLSIVPPATHARRDPTQPERGTRILFDFGPSDPANGAPTGVDKSGRTWNDWLPLAGGGTVYSGEHVGGLLADSGAPTGIGLAITGEMVAYGIQNGGLLEPAPALLGNLAVPTATEDYFYGNHFPLPAGFLLHELDPRLAYDLTFFSTRATAQTQVSSFRVVGRDAAEGELQTSGAGSGSTPAKTGNDDTLLTFHAVRPDRFGRIYVDLDTSAGPNAYLGLLEITVRAPRVPEGPAPR